MVQCKPLKYVAALSPIAKKLMVDHQPGNQC